MPAQYLKVHRCLWRHFAALGMTLAQQRLVLVLMSYDGPRGCYPSPGTIAKEIGAASVRTVRSDLKALAAAGWLRIECRALPEHHHYDLRPLYDRIGDMCPDHRERRDPPEAEQATPTAN